MIRCGVVGYGRNFNFGRMHGRWISACPEMTLAAVCDIGEASRDQAAKDFPEVRTYGSVTEMLTSAELDLAVIEQQDVDHLYSVY